MKHFTWVALFFLLVSAVSAQEFKKEPRKGRFYIGLGNSLQSPSSQSVASNPDDEDRKLYHVELIPSFGYYITDYIGVSYEYDWFWSKRNKKKALGDGHGVKLTWNMAAPEFPISPILEASYYWMNESIDGPVDFDRDYRRARFGLGLEIAGNHWAIVPLFRYDIEYAADDAGDSIDEAFFNLQVRVLYYF